jgi:TRAP-type mannitol/chloroaromatic compound transport system permease small subunit
MPSISFILPHWLYWSGLIFFPLIAAWLTRRQMKNPPDGRPTLAIAYLFLALAGYFGIHRFYLRSAWGLVFIPVFLGIVYCNDVVHDLREPMSRTSAAMESAELTMQQADDADKPRLRADFEAKKNEFTAAKGEHDHWVTVTSIVGGVLAALLLVDAILLPGLVRRRRAYELEHHPKQTVELPPDEVHEGGVGQAASLSVQTRFTSRIDAINTRIAEFVAWWAVISVFVYYYEVMARYIFNSPTNWVHESMFLMFGMQYMLCGAFAYKEDQHVRVDVFYAQLSKRGKAIADIVTSVFFFIFMITMLITGYRFAADAVSVGEHSFTEWGVQYWPVKLMIPIGALLLTLQGISKLVKDIVIVREESA